MTSIIITMIRIKFSNKKEDSCRISKKLDIVHFCFNYQR